MSVAPIADLRSRLRATSIVAAAMLGAVAIYWILVEVLARSGGLTHPFRGEGRIGYVVLGVGVGFIIVAGVVRRALLERRGIEPGQRLQAASIVSVALAEVPAVGGLVVFMLTGVREAAYPLFVLSIVALLLYFPRWAQWQEWARAR